MSGPMQKIHSPAAAVIHVDGREILSFGGCSYLGLANVPSVIEAGRNALRDFGATAQLPRHYGYQSPANLAAEDAARRFFGVEAAMYIATGYLFPLIALPGLKDDYNVAILDETAHFCLVEGARAAGREIRTFRHCDADDLERVAAEAVAQGKRILIATDGCFPTFGNIPPLANYAKIAERYGAWLIVDESHGFGAVGKTGRGACEDAQVLGHPKIIAGGSASKGLGAYGGLCLASGAVIDRLWQAPAARGAALGISSGAMMLVASLDHLRANPEIFLARDANCRMLHQRLSAIGIDCPDPRTPIFAFRHGSAKDMQRAQQFLYDNQIFIIYSQYVGAGAEGALRIAVFADHTVDHIERLCVALDKHLGDMS